MSSDTSKELQQHCYLLAGQGGLFCEPTTVSTVLGSCVAVCLFSQSLKIGGTFHAMLPEKSMYQKYQEQQHIFRFVDSGLEYLISEFREKGLPPQRLEAKVFGGASVFGCESFSVGHRNVEIALRILTQQGVRICATSVGGQFGRKLVFRSHTGEAFMKLLRNREDFPKNQE